MNAVDEFLEKIGLKYEDLTPIERETYGSWVTAIEKTALSIDKIRDYIASLRYSVEQDLTKHDLSRDQDLFLKARLRNLMLIEAMLSTPEKAKKALEEAMRFR